MMKSPIEKIDGFRIEIEIKDIKIRRKQKLHLESVYLFPPKAFFSESIVQSSVYIRTRNSDEKKKEGIRETIQPNTTL